MIIQVINKLNQTTNQYNDIMGGTMTKEIKTGLYRHYKGAMYRVEGVATHSETEEKMIIYRPQYGEQALWVRPLVMFIEDVELDGKKQPRFAFIKQN
jgi:hypothetical protein